MSMLRDIDIRAQLIDYLTANSQESNVCVEELGICGGESRIDVAFLDNGIHGYEIKSEVDSLDRLPRQVAMFSRALNFATVVSGKTHLKKLFDVIPDWWGVLSVSKVSDDSSELEFLELRQSKANPSPDLFAVAQFLWRDEALEVLAECGMDKGLRSKPRISLWEQLASDYSHKSLIEVVVEKMSSREHWRIEKT